MYEGSGPDERDFVESEADFASWASRHGNERAGLEESLLRGASSCAPAVACWAALRLVFVCIDLPFAGDTTVDEDNRHCLRIKWADL